MRPPQLRCELFPSIYLPYIHRMNCCSYWTSVSFATLSSHVASYMVSVRQTRGLLWASFRFHIAMDTLAFSYMLTATWSHSGLAPVRVRPCWANKIRPHPLYLGAALFLFCCFIPLAFSILKTTHLHYPKHYVCLTLTFISYTILLVGLKKRRNGAEITQMEIVRNRSFKYLF